MNISKKDLHKNLKKFKGALWDQSPVFKKLYEEEFGQLGGEPYGCLVGDYAFDHSAPDVELPTPDLTLFLDLAPELAAARGGYGTERYEKEALQARVRALFTSMGNETPGWVTVDAGRDREAVAQDLWAHVGPFAHGTDLPIGRLWTTDG